MEYFVSAIIGFLLGSFPTAYILMKKKNGLDITKNGSNNVGAMNSYEVSDSKALGFVVFLIDFAKGIIAVYLSHLFFGEQFLPSVVALIFAVLAHCYSPWIKFKGGRGLATAAGGATLLFPMVLFLWIFFWAIGFAFRKNIHFSNIISTLLTGAISISSASIINSEKWFANPPAENDLAFTIAVNIIMIIILSRHVKPLMDYIATEKNKIRDKRK